MKLDFSKGINTDMDPESTPKGYYLDALNMRATGDSKRSEEGMTQITAVPNTIVQWGNCAIGDQTIVLGQYAGKSIIGSLTKDDVWTVEVQHGGIDVLGINAPTQVEGRRNWAGERIIYFATKSGARRINLDQPLPPGDSEFDKATSLFLEYDLPKTSYVGEQTTGTLLSGEYQIGARLVTDSLATTAFGIVTNPIPVVQSSLQSARQSVVGNPPQEPTTKAINLSITNVDPTFKYIQLGVLTYIGLANTPKVTVSSLIPINGRTTIQYTYRGAADDAEDISVNEFISSGISYATAEYVTQKDGTLLLGAPTEADMPPIDWYRVAENIVSKFIVKKISYVENLTFTGKVFDEDGDTQNLKETSTNLMDQGYKNPITCELYKGYRRNEVYAFTLTPVFTSGVKGPTIHIPCSNVSSTPSNTSGNPDDGGLLGAYISEEKYPDDRYSKYSVTDGIRLHKFPGTDLQPVVSGNIETNNMYIRVLGVRFENIVLHSSELQYADQIAGYIIGRVNRTGNETQLAQGILRSNVDIRYDAVNNYAYGTMIGDGFVSWKSGTAEDGTHSDTYPTTKYTNNCTFISPDLIHKLYTADQASHIYQHSVYKANPNAANSAFNRGSLSADGDGRTGYSLHKAFFKNITGDSTTNIDRTEIELNGLKVTQGPFGIPNAPGTKGGKINTSVVKGSQAIQMASSDGFVWLNTLSNNNIPYHKDYPEYWRSYQHAASGNDHDNMEFLLPNGTRVNFVVHSLSRRNTKQYGAIDQMVAMFTHYESAKSFNGIVEFFNGDTFITKYGLSINDEAYYPYSTNDDADNPNKVGFLKPCNASGIVYFWVESNNNYDYRHFIQPQSYTEGNMDGVSGTVPFFPAYKILMSSEPPIGILSMHADGWTRPGYASQYNNQYSAQPTIFPYAVTPKEDVERKASLLNRIVYSAVSIQGEKSDAYQIFLPNNYYDLPTEHGIMSDLYVNLELYASTPQVQWKLFYNTLATQATSIGEVVLGNGGAFNRPAVPMTTVDGGYGGTSHWTHAVNTVYGRVFVDKLQGKWFIMREHLTWISPDLDDNYRITIQGLNDTQIKVGSEPLRERAIIRLGETTYSYNLPGNFIDSRHSYQPMWMFSHGPYLYSNQTDPLLNIGQVAGGTNIGIFKHGTGPAGKYYGKVFPSTISLSANEASDISKLYKTIELINKCSTNSGNNLPFTTFDQMEIWNNERYTGLIDLKYSNTAFELPGVLECLAYKVKDTFRISVPKDIVINPNNDIFVGSNHSQLKGDAVKAKWLAKMRGNFAVIKLIYNNTEGPIRLYSVLVDVSENIR